MDDWELLRAYAEGSEAAFANLLRRHVDPVYSAALRRIRDPQLAQDITQRVFCLLARKASSLPRTGSLIGWLHHTACHLASETLRSDRRRRHREAEAALLNAIPSESATDNAWQQVAPQLDEALLELPETDRLALLLRFFQKLPLRDVGERLGVSEAAAKMRVGRAVMKLRQGLGVRGITLTAGALVWLLADKSVVAAPAGCVSGVTAAVASIGAGGAISPVAALLAWLNPLTAPTAIVAGLLLLTTLGTVVLSRSPSDRGTGSTDPGVFSELSESNVLALDATGPDASTTGGSDLIDDPRQVELAIAHLQNTLREPFSRRVPRDRLRDALLPLGRHSRLAVPMVMSELRDAQRAGGRVETAPMIQVQCVEVLRQMGTNAEEAIPELVKMLKDGKFAVFNDAVVGLFTALQPSTEVLHELVHHLIDPEATPSLWTGRLVASLLEQNPSEIASALQSLQAGLAGAPPDRQLQLAQTLALVPGSNPELLRPVLERHLLLTELRDPAHYLPVTVGSSTDMAPVQQRMVDDVTRRSAVGGLVALGAGARESIPILQELAKRTTDSHLRDEALRAIGSIDPNLRFSSPEVAAAWDVWESDNSLMALAKSGAATPEDLRSGLKSGRTVDAAAAQIANLGEDGRDFVPDLLDALNRTGSCEAAQGLKKLAPDQLIHCLQNPAAFTAEEPLEFKANPARDALVEAAQALGELGPQGSLALPALRAALEIPDKQWVRTTLEKAIHDIDPNAPVSVFTGESVIPASNALIQARNDAERAGNVDRARLAESTAQRIEFNHGMTRKELMKIAADLQAADPDLQAIYVQALREANPSLRDSLAMRP